MRIPCPYCGERGSGEFTYWGDASLVRPETPVGAPLEGETLERWMDYTFLRANPAGEHRELWQHASGCRTWLVVTRNVSTHVILAVEPARDRPRARTEVA